MSNVLERVHSYIGEGGLITMNHELEGGPGERRADATAKKKRCGQSLPGNKSSSVVSHAHVYFICKTGCTFPHRSLDEGIGQFPLTFR